MEFYGRDSPISVSQSGLQPPESDPQTGLQEPMMDLGLGSNESYPERPDCVYYMRTGFCGYGTRCRYNHPRNRATFKVEADVRATGDYPERPPCQFYLKTGSCKFGASCKFHHPKHAAGSLSNVPINAYGYPIRPGEKECFYYLKTGQCKFGTTCKFHHPQPTDTQMPASAPQFYKARYIKRGAFSSSSSSSSMDKQSIKLQQQQEVIEILSSPSSTEKDSPIRSMFCVKEKIHMELIEKIEDCFILDFDPSIDLGFSELSVKSIQNDDHDLDGDSDGDISVIAEKGQVACRDYPHSRHLCAKNPFNKTPHEDYCELCYCYVCDLAAPCEFWTVSGKSHCHASDRESSWKLLRRANIKDSTYSNVD